MTDSIFIFAGEKSGDLHGSNLIKELRKRAPDVNISGVGGLEMREQNITCIMPTEDFELMGFSDTLLSLPKIRKQFKTIKNYIMDTNPKAVVLIDYPGFNLRMARSLNKNGYKGKIIQYVSPSVWAWGKNRIRTMVENLDTLLTIYPFEEKCFAATPLDVQYVGNPIQEHVQKHKYQDNWSTFFGIKNKEHLIGLFPGSRKGEIRRILPCQLKVAEMIKKENPDACFVLCCAHEEIMPVMHEILKKNKLKLNQDIFLLPKAYTYELMRDCRSAIAKSGSVTLELALHGTPTVVVYKLSLFNRIIAQYILRLNLPHYCIVNILADKTVYPEIIEKGFTPKTIFDSFKKINEDGDARDTCIQECLKLKDILQGMNSSEEAAQKIIGLIN